MSAGQGENAPNRRFFDGVAIYGVHLRYTVESRGFSTLHARPHRSKRLFNG